LLANVPPARSLPVESIVDLALDPGPLIIAGASCIGLFSIVIVVLAFVAVFAKRETSKRARQVLRCMLDFCRDLFDIFSRSRR
jgi:hypothetical protein